MKEFKSVVKILGLLLMLLSSTMLVPLPVAYALQDPDYMPFVTAFVTTFATGLILYGFAFRHPVHLKIRDGFLIVTLFWTVLSLFGALPFWLSTDHTLGLTASIFESVSGFTTTGATNIQDLAQMPPALLYYRQQLQFLGGMGIIVLAVAILPMLGIGGMQLYRAETPGPMKDDKITPRIAETAKAIWMIYVGLTLLCALGYWLSGVPGFDALEESFSTVATGGFTIHNNSFAYYHSNWVELVGILFMFLGGINFSLHYLSILNGSGKPYWRDPECRAYVRTILLALIIVSFILWLYGVYQSPSRDIMQSLFSIVAVMTTTGYTSADYASWPTFVPLLLIILGLGGACGSSTSGGIKIIRLLLLKKKFFTEIQRLIHPQGIFLTRLGQRTIDQKTLSATWAFFAAFVGLFVIFTMLLMACGLSLEDALGAAAASIGNIGVGIGQYAYSFANLPDFGKWVMIFAMLVGRLEIFTVLVLFSRSFWKR